MRTDRRFWCRTSHAHTRHKDIDVARSAAPIAGARSRAHNRADLARVTALNRGRSVCPFGARCLGSLRMPHDKPSGVGETAVGAAMMRSDESARRDRLFDDPYAAAFVAAVPDAFADGPEPGDPEIAALTDAFRAHVAIRTRFYDDYLRTACARGCQQVVVLAAGLDARAFRLNWPAGVRLFELDLPEVLAFKDGVLAELRATPRCTRITVSIDLRDEWPIALTDA